MLQADLRAWRISNRYTQKRAAEKLWISLSHYQKWEYGNAAIPRIVEAYIRLLLAANK